MPVSAAVLKTHEALKRTCASLQTRTEKIKAEVVKRGTRVKEAKASGEITVIQVQQRALKADIGEATALMKDADAASMPLSQLQNDAAFMKDRDEDADKLAKIIGGARTEAGSAYSSLKAHENDLEAAYEKAISSDDYVLGRLTRADERTRATTKSIRERSAQVEKAAERARAAHKARDAKGLLAAQAVVDGLDVFMSKRDYDLYDRNLDSLSNGAAANKGLSAKTRATIEDGVKDLKGELKAVSHFIPYAEKLEKEVKELKIVPLDIDKALKALKIDSKHKAKLTKALSGPPAGYAKALTALAKELKLDPDGEGMLDTLKKAGVI